MSRERNEEKKGLSPTQRKACVVLALCALAVVMSILAAWVLPTKLGLFAGGKDSYDPDAYPLDTTLDSILPQSAADDAYITASVFAGDQYAVTLQKDTRITLNQFVGQEGLQISKALSTSCVNFASDASSYTIPQAIPKMKARRVFVVLGANDVDGSVSVDSFIADYKQFLQSIRSAYAYCDIIAVGIPPVTEDSTNAAETQTRIDQFNQAIAAASSDLGFKYLNTAEALKNTRGYGEGTYFESNGFSTSGARALLEYAKSHACNTMDSRPDTSDIPQRASASAGSNAPVPTSTPTKFTASYEVEDSAKGTLTGNGQTGVSSVEIQADSGTSVNVTAVAAEGFVFYKWSDGVTTATRYDNITKDISVKAMFNDARVELTLDKGDTTIKQGESLTVNAAVKLGNKAYDAANVQWSINDEMEKNGSSLTFKPDAAGTYTIKAALRSTHLLDGTADRHRRGRGHHDQHQRHRYADRRPEYDTDGYRGKRQRRHALGLRGNLLAHNGHAGDLHGQRARHLPHPRSQQRCGQRLCAECQRRGYAGTHRCAHADAGADLRRFHTAISIRGYEDGNLYLRPVGR